MKLALAAVLVACGSASHPVDRGPMPWTRAGVEWSHPPSAGAPYELVPPSIAELHLANGIRVLLVENHRLPIVEVATLHDRAGSREDGAQPGLAALVVDLLDEGSELAFEREAAHLELTIATDYARAQVVTLSDHLAASLDLLAAVITHPNFSDGDVIRVRATRVTELEQHVSRARTVAAQTFDRLVFAGFPYAQPAEGTPRSVALLTLGDVRAFWSTAYGPSSTTIIVAGDVTRAQLTGMLDHSFGRWHVALSPRAEPRLSPAATPQIVYVDSPGASQAAVVIGGRATMANTIDADVANMMFGGNTSARIDRKLRDELAITLGAGSSFWRGQWAATWGIATSLTRAQAADGIRAALALIETTRSLDATTAELQAAKAALLRDASLAFDNTATTVRAIEHLVAQGLPIDHYATYAHRLAAVTARSARAAIASDWTKLSIVIVGDWATIGERVRALGLPVSAAP